MPRKPASSPWINIQGTAPLSVVMAEDLAALRAWADGRTVNAG